MLFTTLSGLKWTTQIFLYLNYKYLLMVIKDKAHKAKSYEQKEKKPKSVSKTWLAFEKLQGTGKINDMKAVLK